jgi:hypothetical protein
VGPKYLQCLKKKEGGKNNGTKSERDLKLLYFWMPLKMEEEPTCPECRQLEIVFRFLLLEEL